MASIAEAEWTSVLVPRIPHEDDEETVAFSFQEGQTTCGTITLLPGCLQSCLLE